MRVKWDKTTFADSFLPFLDLMAVQDLKYRSRDKGLEFSLRWEYLSAYLEPLFLYDDLYIDRSHFPIF